MAPLPLTTQSTDGSLIGIHDTFSSIIRCYDGKITNGSLKFTLRCPSGTSVGADDTHHDDGASISKLLFASSSSSTPSYLVAQRNNSLLLFHLDRGVLAYTIDITRPSSSKKKKKQSSRKSSISAGDESNGVLCDVAAREGKLYVLVCYPSTSSEGDGSSGDKCRVFKYDLNSEGEKLEKKIKVGSVHGLNVATSSGGVEGMALAVSTNQMAIRIKNVLRICDFNGGKLCKIDLASGNNSGHRDEEGSGRCIMKYSVDGKYLVVSTASDNDEVVVLACEVDGEDCTLTPMALLKTKDDASISNLDVATDVDGTSVLVLAFQPIGTASYFDIPTNTSSKSVDGMVPQLPTATLQTNPSPTSSVSSLMQASFHPNTPAKEILLLFKSALTGGGSGTTLPMESLPYSSKLSGSVIVGASLDDVAGDGKKKRKAGAATGNVALAPGDQGQEALSAMDLTSGAAAKKKRVDVDGSDEDMEDAAEEDDFELEEDGEQGGQSIAERLAMLSSAMEQTDDEEDYENDEDDSDAAPAKQQAQASSKSKFNLKSATSETLTTVLTQALSSNDAVQLNIALQVTDRRLVENTVNSLQSLDDERDASDTSEGFMPLLMGHIVRRMARRHSLVMPLGVWVKAILAATARTSTKRALLGENGRGDAAEEERMRKDAREMALKLGPLQNFLNERVECFPQLLRLEGRLALLSQQL